MTPDAPGNASRTEFEKWYETVRDDGPNCAGSRHYAEIGYQAGLAAAPRASGETGGAVAWGIELYDKEGALIDPCYLAYADRDDVDAAVIADTKSGTFEALGATPRVVPLYAAAPATTRDGETPATGPTVEEASIVCHDAYEAEALRQAWVTNPKSRKPWSEVPTANQNCTRAAVRAVLDLFKKGGS